MQISLEPGRYIVAVSGGVDSVVLLDLLRKLPEIQLTVAHFDHGIRPDSSDDQRFVRGLAVSHDLPYVYHRAELGIGASEAAARDARYAFLHHVRQAAAADAVITAHHMDDVLETAILNIVRGTGRRGLSSLRSTDVIKRPLLHVPKPDIIAYARQNGLVWHEDSTNDSDTYARNYVRKHVMTRFQPDHRERLHAVIKQSEQTNRLIDQLVAELLEQLSLPNTAKTGRRLRRAGFIMLPHVIAREVLAAWLRSQAVGEIDRRLLERLVHAAKTFNSGGRVSVDKYHHFIVKKSYLALDRSER